MLHGVRPDTTALKSKELTPKKYSMKSNYDYKAGKLFPTFVEKVTKAGVKTAIFGKVAHGNSSYMKPSVPYQKTGTWECWVDFKPQKGSEYRPAYEIFEGDESPHSDVRGVNAALKCLDQLKGDSFMMMIGFWKPHLPFVAPKRVWNRYENIDIKPIGIQKQNTSAGQYLYANKSQEFHAYGDPHGNMYSKTNVPDKKEALNLTRAYLSAVSYTDDHIGKLLKKLDELGLRESTAIILWADHGFHLGDQGHWTKNTQFEANFNCPLIFDFPNSTRRGTFNQLIETIDLYPTICDYFGIDKPEFCEGESVIPFLNGKERQKQYAYSQCDRGYSAFSVRSERYRYTEWRNAKKVKELGDIELYDHKKDPLESNNLARLPEYQSIIEQHRAQMKRGFKRLQEVDYSKPVSFNGWKP
jgi:iduronate 2-sulfatase